MNPDFIKILEILTNHNVKFFVTGGVSAVIQGAPITTFDLDIVHERSEKNLYNLFDALREMGAFYRTRTDIKIFPELSALGGAGHHLLMTKFGPLDVLGSIGNRREFKDFDSETEPIQLEAYSIKVHTLRSLIQVKEEIGAEKDKAVLPILRRTLEESKK